MGSDGKLAILVGGGPAPGINAVIAAAAIAADMNDLEVLGIRDGFQWLLAGDTTRVERLERHRVERIHFRGTATTISWPALVRAPLASGIQVSILIRGMFFR